MKKFIALDSYKMNMRRGMISFLFHRISGIALFIFLVLHIVSMSSIHLGRESFEQLMKLYNTLGFHIMEYFLGLAVIWHVFNGFRLLLIDLFRITQNQKLLSIFVWIFSVLAAIASFPVFIPEVLGR